jgi:Ran GTPase-activating protein (RanGAP) involved in mRNA processing and transport
LDCAAALYATTAQSRGINPQVVKSTGVRDDQKAYTLALVDDTLDLCDIHLGPCDAALVAEWLKEFLVSGIGPQDEATPSTAISPTAAKIKQVDISKNIRLLDLSKNKIGDEGIQVLSTALKSTGIENLNLADTGMGVVGLTSLSDAISEMAALNSINVMKNLIGDDGLSALMTAVKGTNIKSITGIVEGQTLIDWSGQDLKPFDMKILAADIEFTPFRDAIRLLNVSANKCFGANEYGKHASPDETEYNEEGWTAICDALKGTQIKTLVLSDIGLTPAGLTIFLNAMSAIAAIDDITLDGNPITGAKWNQNLNGSFGGYEKHDVQMDGFIAICESLKGSSVSKLSLAKCGLGPDAVSTLASAMSDIATALSLVNLLDNKISSDDINALQLAAPRLSGLVFSSGVVLVDKNTPVEKLDLSNCKLVPADMNILANTLAEGTPFSAALSQVNFSNNFFLGGRPANSREEYNKYGNNLPPDLYLDEFRALLQGMQHCNIEKLQLVNVGMGPKGVSTLAEYITDMAALSEVNLHGAKVEESDIVALRSAVPNVSFSW